jgi:hypothetical protein
MNTDAGYRVVYQDKEGKHVGTHVYKIEKEAWTDARALSTVDNNCCWNITVVWADTKIPTTTYAMLSKKNAKRT